MTKYSICEMANRLAYQCVQLHGGYGYMEEYPVCRVYSDVRCHNIYAGATEIMKSIIAGNAFFVLDHDGLLIGGLGDHIFLGKAGYGLAGIMLMWNCRIGIEGNNLSATGATEPNQVALDLLNNHTDDDQKPSLPVYPEWMDTFPNKLLGAAIIDRFCRGAYIVGLEGKSFRAPRPMPKRHASVTSKISKSALA